MAGKVFTVHLGGRDRAIRTTSRVGVAMQKRCDFEGAATWIQERILGLRLGPIVWSNSEGDLDAQAAFMAAALTEALPPSSKQSITADQVMEWFDAEPDEVRPALWALACEAYWSGWVTRRRYDFEAEGAKVKAFFFESNPRALADMIRRLQREEDDALSGATTSEALPSPATEPPNGRMEPAVQPIE